MTPPSSLAIYSEMELIDLPLRAFFLTLPPTGRYFSPTLPSDCFAIDFPRRAMSPGEGLPLSFTSR